MRFTKGNMFYYEEKFTTLVNPVNCFGVMGAGLALEFKQRYPENFGAYVKACSEGRMIIGKMLVHPISEPTDLDPTQFIINFPTKNDPKNPSHLDYIRLGADHLYELLSIRDFGNVAIPALGCGLGGLLFTDVRDILQERLHSHLNVTLFEPV